MNKCQKIISRLFKLEELSRRSKLTIFVDENISSLEESLRLHGFKVYSLPKGLKDSDIIKQIEGDTILTRNSKDFIKNAVRFDIDIINADNLKFIDKDQTIKNITAKLVSDAIRGSKYYNKRGNFMVTLKSDGNYKLEELK